MDYILTFLIIGAILGVAAIFLLVFTWNKSMEPDHTRISPLSRSIAQTLIIAILLAIITLVFLI
ncbi:MAG: hypothetical protein DWP98_11650 [Bacteroidetes bacterium]|nr:MAG: hypothetical protein DWP98_11650 [Bacteroidota bacterium]MBL1144011.1 hypothetical protein [Bacteroidota bacterium]NOG56812.1 hypothetical protein [Bacteroidota bacterium]